MTRDTDPRPRNRLDGKYADRHPNGRGARNESSSDCRDVGMTQMDDRTEEQMTKDKVSKERDPSAEELLAWRRDNVFLPDAEVTPEEFPRLQNISAGFLFGGMVRPLEPAPAEYVTLSMPHLSRLEFAGAVGQWNTL